MEWHILREDNQKQEQRREELMIKLWLRHWLFARIVENGMFITLYVELADTTEVNSQSKKKQLYNCSTV